MRINVPATVLLLGLTSTVQAESGILIAHVPSGADRTIVLAVMRQALESHGWNIAAADARAISASIDGNKTDASIRLRLEDHSISYEGDATLTVATNGQSLKKPVDIPARWLKALRIDIGNALATMPDQPAL